MDENGILVPARMLNEVVFCPRLAYLEWIEGEFAHNADTIQGRDAHRNVDRSRKAGLEPLPKDIPFVSTQVEELGDSAPQVLRSLSLSDEALGITAVIDLCEFESGVATPVDTKKGSSKNGCVWEADQVQLCAQCMLLESVGYRSKKAIAWYATDRRRAEVIIDNELIDKTIRARDYLLSLNKSRIIPPPLADDARCVRCSVNGICLPDETLALRGESDYSTKTNPADDSNKVEMWLPSVRRLIPARPETVPLYVVGAGAQLKKREDQLEVWSPEQGSQRVRLMELESVNLFGAVQMTAQAQAALLREDIPICYFTSGGWFTGMTRGLSAGNVEMRRAQYRAADNQIFRLELAKSFITGKVKNQRTMLRRNGGEEVINDLKRLALILKAILYAKDESRLLGLEGAAARLFFKHFPSLLGSSRSDAKVSHSFSLRNRRPPLDPVNAMLSYGYGVLAKEVTIALERAGLDPKLGFYHHVRGGRPALALDLMEEFRPLIIDSIVISLVTRGDIGDGDFLRVGDAVSLTAIGRKKLLGAYERRLETLIQHPIFGYSISYRRVIDVQSRLLGRHLLGEIKEYTPFTTR